MARIEAPAGAKAAGNSYSPEPVVTAPVVDSTGLGDKPRFCFCPRQARIADLGEIAGPSRGGRERYGRSQLEMLLDLLPQGRRLVTQVAQIPRTIDIAPAVHDRDPGVDRAEHPDIRPGQTDEIDRILVQKQTVLEAERLSS